MECHDNRALPATEMLHADSAQLREAALEAAVRIFALAEQGDDSMIIDAERRLAQLVKAEPDNPLIRAYHGASRTLMARLARSPQDQLRAIVEGLLDLREAAAKLMDAYDQRQFRGVPLIHESKLVVAASFLKLPPDAERHHVAAKLLDEIQGASDYSALRPEFRAAVLVSVARLNQHRGDAIQQKIHLDEALALDPLGAAGNEAIRELLNQSWKKLAK